MANGYQLEDAQDAQDFLHAFDVRTRQKGEDYFRGGRVIELVCEVPGRVFSAGVQGSSFYRVVLSYDEDAGWDGECNCPMGYSCKHVYAAMKSLLAEDSMARVRALSAGGRTAPPKPGATPAAKDKIVPLPVPMAETVAAALGRRLGKEESQFLARLAKVYERCARTRHISTWDLDELGMSLSGKSWEMPRLWPSFPETQHEFWLYLANARMERQLSIPEFLKPVTDLAPIRDRLARWRRKEEVERWQQTLAALRLPGAASPRQSRGLFDLRLSFEAYEARIQCKRPGQEKFETLKMSAAQKLDSDVMAGCVELPHEAEMIWRAVSARLRYWHSIDLTYTLPETRAELGRLLRLPLLQSRIVGSSGQPLLREKEPLRWQMTPAANEDDDYRFRLVQANGQPLTGFLFRAPGDPALYVTEEAVFEGPATVEGILDAGAETVIPAPALETHGGIELLQSLGQALPPRLQERVRHVSMAVSIRCELAPTYPGGNTEVCLVTATAQAEDGSRQETWNGQQWYETTPARRGAGNKESLLRVFDRSSTEGMAAILEPLNLKFDAYSGKLTLRVTKKFPDVFAPWLKTVPPHVTVHLGGDLASFANAAVSGRLRLDVTEVDIDWFDLRVVLDVSDTTLTPEEIKLLLNAKGRYVRLGEKGWRRLQFDLSEEEDDRLARLGVNPRELTAEPQRMHALQLADEAARKFMPEQQVESIFRRANELKARVTPNQPAAVQAEMRPYQLEGFHFLAYLAANRFGGILADDMGLGKTLQTLAWLVWLREEASSGRPAPSLAVCPKSVMDNWHAEAARFTPGLRTKVWSAAELNQILERLDEADLHVINYSQLRILGEGLVSVPWLALILDEGQYIKNPSSQTAQVARALRAQYRLVLSGTPIENRLMDLWSLMAFAMPGVLGTRAGFGRLYDAKEDPLARRRLASRVRPFVLRRTKAQVAKDLPDRIEEDLFCEMDGEQKTLYRAELKRAQQRLLSVQTQKQLAQEQFNFLTSLLRLRQICCHPALVQEGTKGSSAKVEALFEQLEPIMEEGQKVLVFSQFVEMLELLKPGLAERDWTTFFLAGETENRGNLVKQFQSTKGAAVFLISLKAGGFGLNLTAASYVVLFDPWWNPAVENQAIDRTHRIGQTNKVIAYRLLIKDSIEEKIRLLQRQKKALAEDVLGEEKFSQSLTLDDLQYLFSD